MIPKTVLAAAAIAAFAALPAAASASTYDATLTFPVIGNGHTYSITVDCSTGTYTGTGGTTADPSTDYTGGEVISGTLTHSSNTGTSTYNAGYAGQPYSFSFVLASTNGTTYSGSLTDSQGSSYTIGGSSSYPASVVSRQANACVPVNKSECKKGGFADLHRTNGTAFKNQGDCVSYTETGK